METSHTPPLVNLEHYSGPLDLLLNLIRTQEMDIFQIDIYKITTQYMEYLKQTPQPDVENAGDFIRMASWLLYIKSKSLIPEDEEQEETETSKLKQQLSNLLIDYQIFQKAGELLYHRTLLGRDCWKSPRDFNIKISDDTKVEMDKEKAIFQLIQAYQKNLMDKKAKKNYKLLKPIPNLFHWLKQTTQIWQAGSRLKFNQLACTHKEKYSRLLSFLSILELSKAGFILLSQKHLFSNIEIFVKKTVTKANLKEFSHEEGEKLVKK